MPGLIDAIRIAVRSGTAPGPELRLALARTEDLATLLAAGRELRELGDVDEGLTYRRITVLPSCPPGELEPLLRACLVGAGVRPGLIVAPPRAFAATLAAGGRPLGADLLLCLLDPAFFLPPEPEPEPDHGPGAGAGSGLGSGPGFGPGSAFDPIDPIAAIAPADPTAPSELWPHLAERLAVLRTLLGAALGAGEAVVVLHTVPLPRVLRDAVLGSRARAALTGLWHRLNASLLALADEYPRVRVVDLVGLLAEAPVPARADPVRAPADPLGPTAPAYYSPGALLLFAQEVRRIVQAEAGLSRRALAIDLASPLWTQAAGELRRTVERLRDQGVRLVLVGGEPAGPVRALPLPPLGAAEQLRRAAAVLGLPLEAFVHLDDSASERSAVAAELPGVAVVGAEGPADRLARALLRHGWFDQP
ncbi:hypothetical protein OG500_21150 [Kitasatospora sp. NBC_01250]|uniref:hypothetical protein n=1 Tax=Kitasatospora sp. NBC_01250 TaxID=2903571 RepID=UPI002E341D34|nr:hypothetical protein [Kitasatospora sp. NBC_01250]